MSACFDQEPRGKSVVSDQQEATKDRVNGASVDAAEVDKFAAMAESWWDPEGDFRPLHRLNPTRVGFIRDEILAHFDRAVGPDCLKGLRILDIGCGGGLVCEPLVRLGATVTGIDATHRNISIAQAHAAQVGLAIDYRAVTAESLIEAGERFDVVICLEVIEHVHAPDAFVALWEQLLAPGGVLMTSTLNKSLPGFLMGVVGAEYIMRWLPVGTHDWRKFVSPSTMQQWLKAVGLRPRTMKGMSYRPLTDTFTLSHDLSVNYIASATRVGENPPTEPEFELP